MIMEYRYPLNYYTNNTDWICDAIDYVQQLYPNCRIWWRINTMTDELIIRVQDKGGDDNDIRWEVDYRR